MSGKAESAVEAGRILTGPAVPESIKAMSGATLVELLDLAVARNPEACAFVMPRGGRLERWTYTDLARATRRVEATFAADGVEPGTRVVTWAPNDPWLVAAYFALWRRGAVVVPLDLRMAPDVALRIGRSVEPVLTLAGSGVTLSDAAALGAPVLEVGPDLASESGDSEVVAAPSSALSSVPPPAPSALAEILFTSGTTSDPKGVMLTHAQLVHSARTITIAAGADPERALALIPLSHMYGQLVPLFHGLMTGTQLTFLPSLTPAALLAAMQRDRITAITAVPQLMKLLMDGIEAEARRSGREAQLRFLRQIARHAPMPVRRTLFRSALARFGGELRTISCGGALLPADLQLAWESLGIVVVQGYGSTECASISSHTRSSRRPGTVGTPLAGLSVRVASDGEVLARGPNVMLGYWNKPEQTAEVLEGGWAHTGDAGEIDGHGELVIRGRTRDRIALPNGLKVYPEDVEAAIVAAGPVRAAVLLEAEPGRLAAIVLPGDDRVPDSDLAQAIERANRSLAPHQRVRKWVRWPAPDFPRTHTLKIRRRDVQSWFAAQPAESLKGVGQAAAVSAVEPGSPGGRRSTAEAALTQQSSRAGSLSAADVLSVLARIVSDVAAADRDIPAEAASPVGEVGLDSLARVELAMRIEEAFGASLDDSDIAAAADLGSLARLVAASRGAPSRPEPPGWAHGRVAVVLRRGLDRLLTNPLVSLVARPRAAGLENLRGLEKPFLLCPNHASHLDALAVRSVLPSAVRDRLAIAAAADYFFAGGPLGPAVALATGAFPFGRTQHVRASLERVAAYVEHGWSVMIFPEGTRSTTGRMGAVKPGIGFLAMQLGVPVVPVGIRGTYAILPKGARLPRRRGALVDVAFGPPLMFEPGCTPQEATRRIDAAIRDLAEADSVRSRPIAALGHP